MANEQTKDLTGIIVRTPGNCGGRPRIAGRRVEVRSVVGYYNAGESPEEIVDHFSDLDVASVYAALAYYHLNKASLDGEFAALDQEEEALAKADRAKLEPAH